MTTPNPTTPAPAEPAPTVVPVTPPVSDAEPEVGAGVAEVFLSLREWLVRDVERARIAAGLIAMLGVAILRRLWQAGSAASHLAPLALCTFAAAGVVLALASRLGRGVAATEAVVRTTGRDVTHTMTTLRSMREVFRALGAALVATCALVVIATAVYLTRS